MTEDDCLRCEGKKEATEDVRRRRRRKAPSGRWRFFKPTQWTGDRSHFTAPAKKVP